MRRLRGYVHNYAEAALIMHAVRLGLLEPAKDRLCLEERDSIKTGHIFCFLESEDGMKRWTDGKIWSPSKISGQFLLYKEVPRELSKSALKKSQIAGERRLRNHPFYGRTRHMIQSEEDITLFKKTISIAYGNKTYHIISYYQPRFDKRGILDIPFFKELNKALTEFPTLYDDVAVEHLLKDKDEMCQKYNLPQPTVDKLKPDIIDREELERQAMIILRNGLRLDL